MTTAPQKSSCDDYELSIRVGNDDDAEFFLHVEEETTFESLPPDFHAIARDELRARLLETHEMLLGEEGHIFFIAFDQKSGQNMGLLWFRAAITSPANLKRGFTTSPFCPRIAVAASAKG